MPDPSPLRAAFARTTDALRAVLAVSSPAELSTPSGLNPTEQKPVVTIDADEHAAALADPATRVALDEAGRLLRERRAVELRELLTSDGAIDAAQAKLHELSPRRWPTHRMVRQALAAVADHLTADGAIAVPFEKPAQAGDEAREALAEAAEALAQTHYPGGRGRAVIEAERAVRRALACLPSSLASLSSPLPGAGDGVWFGRRSGDEPWQQIADEEQARRFESSGWQVWLAHPPANETEATR